MEGERGKTLPLVLLTIGLTQIRRLKHFSEVHDYGSEDL